MTVLEMDNVLMDSASVMLGTEMIIAQQDCVLQIVAKMENVIKAFANVMMDLQDLLAIERNASTTAIIMACAIMDLACALNNLKESTAKRKNALMTAKEMVNAKTQENVNVTLVFMEKIVQCRNAPEIVFLLMEIAIH